MTLLSPKTTLRDDRCLTWGGLLFPLIDFACALPVCAPALGGGEPPHREPAILRNDERSKLSETEQLSVVSVGKRNQ
ncbi:hypothetical protein HNY73_016201 [Argiope bruennichi]|uniref:Uncharacterized protein n=1 Tax=Argiope bruennichi TaxID=94029 RepID=A0A8T0ELG7_ARGBR|nr:hypothetical protein HNY73_016201 [Argiope bruennichi]